jgi:hypothetical protein
MYFLIQNIENLKELLTYKPEADYSPGPIAIAWGKKAGVS